MSSTLESIAEVNGRLRREARQLSPTREFSQVLTKLDEAEMWLGRYREMFGSANEQPEEDAK